jgi:putative transposase
VRRQEYLIIRPQVLTNTYKRLQTTINVCYPTNSSFVRHFRRMEIREQLKAGNTYHICTKSNGTEDLFRDVRDYFYFHRKMEERLTEAWEIIAYALIPNEIHLVVKISKKKIDGEIINHATLLSHLFNGYVQHYNFKYCRQGSLLSRSFRRKSIPTELELQETISKVHNLPLARKLVVSRRDWLHSSYKKFTEQRFGTKHMLLLVALFKDIFNFEHVHELCTCCIKEIMPKRKWIKCLTPQEIAFRKKHPLGGHRWNRRNVEGPS